jgi:oligopeptide/dipeptide ABC transporter ATP-binding protein
VSAPLLEVEDLHVWFPLGRGRELHAVRGVSFAIDRGEALGLVGESGCGKTTAVMAIVGLLPRGAAVAGSVRLDGKELLDLDEDGLREHRWRDVAVVFQSAMNSLNPVMTVGRQIEEARRRRREPLPGDRTVDDLLGLVGIAARRARAYPHELSGGMRQRVALAMALAAKPRLLLADEPTTGLDVMVQAQILELLRELRDELGLALMMVSHDLPVVGRICPRGAVMYGGRIVESGPLAELHHRPAHPYTAMLFAATPDLHRHDRLASIPGVPPRLDEPIAGCPFRPRCPRALDRCATVDPRDRAVGADHATRCHAPLQP